MLSRWRYSENRPPHSRWQVTKPELVTISYFIRELNVARRKTKIVFSYSLSDILEFEPERQHRQAQNKFSHKQTAIQKGGNCLERHVSPVPPTTVEDFGPLTYLTWPIPRFILQTETLLSDAKWYCATGPTRVGINRING